MRRLLSSNEITTIITDKLVNFKIAEALQICNEQLQIQPKNPIIYFARSVVHFQSRQYQDVITDIHTAILFWGAPNEEIAQKKVKYAILLKYHAYPGARISDFSPFEIYMLAKVSLLQLQDVIDMAEMAERMQIQSESIYMTAGSAADSLKRDNDAIKYYTKAITCNPNNLQLYILRGSKYFSKQESWPAHAADDFRHVLKHDPENFAAFKGAASALLAMKEFLYAVVYACKACVMSSTDAVANKLLAEALIGIENQANAFINDDQGLNYSLLSSDYKTIRVNQYKELMTQFKSVCDQIAKNNKERYKILYLLASLHAKCPDCYRLSQKTHLTDVILLERERLKFAFTYYINAITAFNPTHNQSFDGVNKSAELRQDTVQLPQAEMTQSKAQNNHVLDLIQMILDMSHLCIKSPEAKKVLQELLPFGYKEKLKEHLEKCLSSKNGPDDNTKRLSHIYAQQGNIFEIMGLKLDCHDEFVPIKRNGKSCC